MKKALAGFMDKLGIGKAHLVGHSMGGAIAMQMAADDPSKVKSLTLICSAGLGPEIGSYVDEYVAAQGRKDLKPALEQLFADKSLVSRQLVDDVLKYKRLDGVEPLLKSLAQALFGGRKQQDAPSQGLAGKLPPTLVIWGKEDEIIPAAHAATAGRQGACARGRRPHGLHGEGQRCEQPDQGAHRWQHDQCRLPRGRPEKEDQLIEN